VGDSNTYVQAYLNGAWTGVYGTSVGAPQWAAIVAIANQGKALAGQGTFDGSSQLLPAIYKFSSSDFHDVTSGSAGVMCRTKSGALAVLDDVGVGSDHQ
jgi:hypothetical protein